MDTYKTILDKTPGQLYKEKNSKFHSYAFPVGTVEEVKLNLEHIRSEHPGAGHYCYAWQIGTLQPSFRANDDGEPSNSAGMPIYGQIQSFQLTHVLVVVVRYFGGTKLGVGGLISAYRTAAQLALAQAEIIERHITKPIHLTFDYKHTSKVMRILRENRLEIDRQEMKDSCTMEVRVPISQFEQVFEKLKGLFEVQVSKL